MKNLKFRFYDKTEKRMKYLDGIFNMPDPSYDFNEIQQFTGLVDRLGKEIYEGDIVNIVIRENIGTFNVPDDIIANGGYTGREDIYEGEVIFKDFGFCINNKKEGEFYLQPMEDTFFKIIGNIYENPELLKA